MKPLVLRFPLPRHPTSNKVSEFKDKFVLITGCSSGIGLATARRLKARGYPVIATARRAESVAELKAEGFVAFELDLRSPESIGQAVDATLSHTGGHLYALFNNGAYGQPGAVEDLSREVLRAQFETNLLGTHDLTRRVIPVMRRNGGGRIIQNSSILGLVALRYRGAYNATKFALEGLTDTLRLELRGSGIEVILIEPGPIESAFRNNALEAFHSNIDIEGSVHRETYTRLLSKLRTVGPVAPGTLGSDAVADKVIKALESRRPRARYGVTWPTTLLSTLKRLLPDGILDRLVTRL